MASRPRRWQGGRDSRWSWLVALDGPAPIRVLLWLAAGIDRAMIAAALGGESDLVIVEGDAGEAGRRDDAALRDAIARTAPDVVVTTADAATIARLTDGVRDAAAVFVSTDSRSALAWDGDVSLGALARLVRSVAPCAHPE